MGLTFRKSIKIANGLKLNLSKSGVSLTAGKKGIHYTINSKGKSTASVGIPGTGISYRKSFNLLDIFSNTKEDKKTNKSNDSLNNISKQELEEYNTYIKQIKSFHISSTKIVDWKSLALASVPSNLNSSDRLKWEKDITLAKRIINEDIDAYLEVIQKYSSLNDISAYGIDFEFGITDFNILSIRFEPHTERIIPKVSYKQDEQGNIIKYKLRSGQYNDIALDYVCSCSIRIAREVFALLPIDYILVNSEEEMLDTSTGNNMQTTITSILFTRDGFNNINFEKIDPSDFCPRFKMNMSFTKTGGFKPVKEIDDISV